MNLFSFFSKRKVKASARVSRSNFMPANGVDAVDTLYALYNNELPGGATAFLCVNWRASAISGNGANFSVSKKIADAEVLQTFVADWSEKSGFTGTGAWELARNQELEGKLVVYNEGSGKDIIGKTLPFYSSRYKVVEYSEDKKLLTYQDDQTEQRLEDFFIARFSTTQKREGGRIVENYNNVTPRLARIMDSFSIVEQAYNDLRGNNRLFNRPVRKIQTKDQADAAWISEMLFDDKKDVEVKGEESKKDTGELIIFPGTSGYDEPTGSGSKSLTEEIQLHGQRISAFTGYPLHLMGYPQLLSNRSTAEDMHEMINVTTVYERQVLADLLRDLAVDACHKAGFPNVKKTDIQVKLPVVLFSQIASIATFYVTLWQTGAITLQTLREMIPGIDPEKEADRAEKEANASEELARKQMTEFLRNRRKVK